jgi:hypothetical protein
MTYHHPTIRIEQPAPGHYVISGHNPASVLVPETGHVVPLGQCYIPPELPSEVLLAIIADRGDAGLAQSGDAGERPPLQSGDTGPKRVAGKGGRK